MMPIGGESCFVIHTMKAGVVFFSQAKNHFHSRFLTLIHNTIKCFNVSYLRYYISSLHHFQFIFHCKNPAKKEYRSAWKSQHFFTSFAHLMRKIAKNKKYHLVSVVYYLVYK